jgi:early secretory antigenic target protein ESAT-6
MELDGLKVNHAGLDQAADDLMGIVNKIDSRMNDLERELNPLRSQWIGDAKNAYDAAKTKWDGAIHEMRDLLHSTSQQVSQSNSEYKSADARGARSFDI